MSQALDIKVPDIGDFKDVEVIEILVKPGDTVAAEQSLITVESDKASMEIPSPMAGVLRELRVKLGDRISTGSPLAPCLPQRQRPPRQPQRQPRAHRPLARLPQAPPTPDRWIAPAAWSCSVQARAATPQHSAPPTSALIPYWSSATERWAAFA